MKTLETQCCVVGGGPAGMMLGFLLARAGVRTIVLEKHGDFLRDFRGDTVHPSTTQAFADMGFLEEFLKVPHQRANRLLADFGGTLIPMADFTHLDTACPYIAFMPQWDLLNFLAAKGKALSALEVHMQTKVTGLIREEGRVVGVTAESADGPMEVRATLTVGADGRRSTVREAMGAPVHDLGSPIDVLWFRVGKNEGFDEILLHSAASHVLITIDRADYFQCAYVVAKGSADALKARPIEEFRSIVNSIVPTLRMDDVKSWDDVKLLTVALERLEQWSAPGVLCIGDAAHTMSPVGGVGINLAVQDAIATANLLAAKLRAATVTEDDVNEVQRRRMPAVRIVQRVQQVAHRRLLTPVLSGENASGRPPLLVRVLFSGPLRFLHPERWTARFIGLGVRQERVRSGVA